MKFETEVPHEGSLVLAKFISYPYSTGFRFHVILPRQRAYFEIMDTESFNWSDVIDYFNNNRLNIDYARCFRCSKWAVMSGYLCERCEKATNSGEENGSNTWYELSEDCKKIKI